MHLKTILGNECTYFEGAKTVRNVQSFEESLFLNKAKIMYRVVNNMIPSYVCDIFQRRSDSIINTSLRSVSNENCVIPKPTLSISKESL